MLRTWNEHYMRSTYPVVELTASSHDKEMTREEEDDYPLFIRFENGNTDQFENLPCDHLRDCFSTSDLGSSKLDFRNSKCPGVDFHKSNTKDYASQPTQHMGKLQSTTSQTRLRDIEGFDHTPPPHLARRSSPVCRQQRIDNKQDYKLCAVESNACDCCPLEKAYHPVSALYGQMESQFEQLRFDFDTGTRVEQLDVSDHESNEALQGNLEFEPNFDFSDHPSPLPTSNAIEKLPELERERAFDVAEFIGGYPPDGPDTTKRKPLQPFATIKILRGSLPTSTSQDTRMTQSESEGSRRDRRRHRSAKTKAQYQRDRGCRSFSVPLDKNTTAIAACLPTFSSQELGPKRKHCAFVQEQELKFRFEDRVGTPHISELQPGDGVHAQLNVDELSVGGEVAALSIMDRATQSSSIFEVTDIPDEQLKLR